ncbi:prolyl oligopeptidase family serine peptidase [Terricaulis silvestris]|uniref:Prolyl endopeptidase n=1 Tax=Terricaulis silvestris TaxID=2686094 RepID=A0A6I6MJK5_9CAUL|nr:prolyl oligopeptidase family serine peptidase [Terricaulis silvestris]QGZ95350.1 Prolyl endopeptidase [Terricaulis silvestris]
MRLSAIAAACASAFILGSCATSESPSTTAMTSTDPYLWLEQVEGERAIAWVRQQNERSLGQLESDPRFAELHAEALEIANSRDRLPLGEIREGYLYNFWQDETHVRGIWRRSPLAAYARGEPQWETLLDIDALAATESANWVYKGVDCLEGHNRCMVQLSDGGRDASTYREFDLSTRRFVEGGFVVPEAKSSTTWIDADTLLVGTDWGPENGTATMTESGYPFVMKRWRRGTPLASAEEVMRGAASDVGVYGGTLEDVDGRRVPVVVEADTFFESTFWRLDTPNAERITLPAKATLIGLYRGHLLFTLEEAWRGLPQGALAAYPLADTNSDAPRAVALFSPNPRQSIESVTVTHDAVLVALYDNVRGQLLRIALDGNEWTQSQVDLPTTGSISFAGSSATDERAFAVYEDHLTPSTLYALENRATTARRIRSLPPQFDASPYVAEQFEATSRDGTRVPYFVVRRRDMPLNGENPTLLWAYGGFQVSYTPTYSPNVGKLWLDNGGVYVLANIRGGGEFGPAWHQAGLRTNRQVIFDDFYAVEQDLVNRRITSPRRLGIMGGSNGGLLMGVMLNQHPEMINAAVVQVPLLDMLRYDQLLAGASWVDEYGSPSNPTERAFLEQISPYQNLRAREDFPLPFVLTSTKDDRVHPGHARKYVARMIELGMPVLYYENIDGGHSAAANLNEAARRRALEYTYLMRRLMD